MDNISKRRIVAIVGILIAFAGLTGLIWGILKRDSIMQLIGFLLILAAYVCTLLMKRIRKKELQTSERK